MREERAPATACAQHFTLPPGCEHLPCYRNHSVLNTQQNTRSGTHGGSSPKSQRWRPGCMEHLMGSRSTGRTGHQRTACMKLLLSVDGLPVQLAACATFLRCVAPGFHDGKACCSASGQGIPARQATVQLPGAGCKDTQQRQASPHPL